ncbi:hypothetical protein SAMN05660359_03323 [Geodermatophilus obscurus]|jgi:hypothetical protein|uniref:Uncharacterized protein n=1 Tax=Geodermatophilus obscurus TaxID=1861 RepID=A0A1I5H214_9ACTN|nr:hypothetical protein [Geodermatophilus obscurus]SFO42247.1 hypothetical protein SAMN05660359_03323 [Geodermatophilus obscurus]
MQITPQVLEQEFSLQTAATRLDFLSRRDSGAGSGTSAPERDEDDWTSLLAQQTSLDVAESLEVLALGEVIARKAHDSQLIGFRAALRGGASWEQIAAALDVAPAEAWTSYHRAIERQERAAVLGPQEAAEARELAGDRPS